MGKPIGQKVKSVVGRDENNISKLKSKPLVGILFDRYFKIPKPNGNKIKKDWLPEYLVMLQKDLNVS